MSNQLQHEALRFPQRVRDQFGRDKEQGVGLDKDRNLDGKSLYKGPFLILSVGEEGRKCPTRAAAVAVAIATRRMLMSTTIARTEIYRWVVMVVDIAIPVVVVVVGVFRLDIVIIVIGRIGSNQPMNHDRVGSLHHRHERLGKGIAKARFVARTHVHVLDDQVAVVRFGVGKVQVAQVVRKRHHDIAVVVVVLVAKDQRVVGGFGHGVHGANSSAVLLLHFVIRIADLGRMIIIIRLVGGQTVAQQQ